MNYIIASVVKELHTETRLMKKLQRDWFDHSNGTVSFSEYSYTGKI
jgi:hypothetical protein